MGRIVAIGGGELDTTHRINKYIVKLAGKKNLTFYLYELAAMMLKVIYQVSKRNLRA